MLSLALLAGAGLAAVVIVLIWMTHTTRRAADSTIAARDRDVQREWAAEYQRFVSDVNRDGYAPEWKQGILGDVKAGTDHLQAGAFSAAAAAFEKARSADPNNAYLLTLTGSAWLHAGDAIQAAKYFDAAVFAHPDYAWGYYQLAVAHCVSGRTAAAREAVAAALASSPGLDQVVRLDPILAATCAAVVE